MLVSLSRLQQDFLRKYIRQQTRKFITIVPLFIGMGLFVIYLGFSDHDIFNIIAAAFGIAFLLISIFIVYSSIDYLRRLNSDLRRGNIEELEGIVQKKESYKNSSYRVTIGDKKYVFLKEVFEKITTGETAVFYYLPDSRIVIDVQKTEKIISDVPLTSFKNDVAAMTQDEMTYFKRDLRSVGLYIIAAFISLIGFAPTALIVLPFRGLLTEYLQTSEKTIVVIAGITGAVCLYVFLIRRFRKINLRIIQEGKKRIQTLPIDELKDLTKKNYRLAVKSNGKQFTYSIDEPVYKKLQGESHVTVHTDLSYKTLFYLYTDKGELLYNKFAN